MATPKQALRQEAAAWRKCAEWVMRRPEKRRFLCHRLTPPLGGFYDAHPSTWPVNVMRSRLTDHSTGRGTLDIDDIVCDKDNGTRSLFCLLMALECEEEARA